MRQFALCGEQEMVKHLVGIKPRNVQPVASHNSGRVVPVTRDVKQRKNCQFWEDATETCGRVQAQCHCEVNSPPTTGGGSNGTNRAGWWWGIEAVLEV